MATIHTMICFSTFLGSSLYYAAFGSSRIIHSRTNIANDDSDLFDVAPINPPANVSSLVVLNATIPKLEVASVECSNTPFGEFPGYLSCLNAIGAISMDTLPRTIGIRGSIDWDYILPFRILSCKWPLLTWGRPSQYRRTRLTWGLTSWWTLCYWYQNRSRSRCGRHKPPFYGFSSLQDFLSMRIRQTGWWLCSKSR